MGVLLVVLGGLHPAVGSVSLSVALCRAFVYIKKWGMGKDLIVC